MGVSITGLSSGLDTASIISQLINIEKQPLARMQTHKDDLSSRISIYQSINSKVASLQTVAKDLSSSSFFSSMLATSATTSVATVTNDSTAVAANYNLNVTSLAKVGIVQSKKFTTNDDFLDGTSITFNYNGQTNVITPDAAANDDVARINSIASKINALSNFGVKASVLNTDGSNYRLVLTTTGTGDAKALDFATDPPAPPADTKTYIDTASAGSLGFTDLGNLIQQAKNADFTVNGVQVTSQGTNTVTNVISGVTLNLAGTGTSNITVGQDTDKITSKVNDFVKAYNDIITTIREKTAKGQSMQGDQTLLSLQDTLFNDLSRVVKNMTGAKNIVAVIGLEVDPGAVTSSAMTGKITFDQTKFKQALKDDPKGVSDLFTFDNNPALPGPDSNDGIMSFIADSLTNWTSSSTGILAKTITGFNSEISTIDSEMTNLNYRLNDKEAALKKQFSDMEVALSKLKSQQSWLTGQLAALSNNKN